MALQSDNTKPAPAGYYYLWHLAALGVITADFGSSNDPIPPNNESALRITPLLLLFPVQSGTLLPTWVRFRLQGWHSLTSGYLQITRT